MQRSSDGEDTGHISRHQLASFVLQAGHQSAATVSLSCWLAHLSPQTSLRPRTDSLLRTVCPGAPGPTGQLRYRTSAEDARPGDQGRDASPKVTTETLHGSEPRSSQIQRGGWISTLPGVRPTTLRLLLRVSTSLSSEPSWHWQILAVTPHFICDEIFRVNPFADSYFIGLSQNGDRDLLFSLT